LEIEPIQGALAYVIIKLKCSKSVDQQIFNKRFKIFLVGAAILLLQKIKELLILQKLSSGDFFVMSIGNEKKINFVNLLILSN